VAAHRSDEDRWARAQHDMKASSRRQRPHDRKSSLAGEEEPAVDTGTAVAAATALSGYPRLTALSAQLSQNAFQDEFDDALHDLIKRVTNFHS
jgi:hypothetical protein